MRSKSYLCFPCASNSVQVHSFLCPDARSSPAFPQFSAESGANAVVIARLGDKAYLVVGTFSGFIRICSISERKEDLAEKFCDGKAVTCITSAGNGSRLAVGGKAAHIQLYQLSHPPEGVRLQPLCRFATHPGGSILSIAMDSNARMLAQLADQIYYPRSREPQLGPYTSISTASADHAVSYSASNHDNSANNASTFTSTHCNI